MITITAVQGVTETPIAAEPGESLREALLRSGLSPYHGRFRTLNCRGMGICGSCAVLVVENGARWSRRSCQIRCFQDIRIELE